MKTLSRSFVLTALVLALSFSAFAQQRNNKADRPRNNRQEMMQQRGQQGAQHERMMNMLDLSEEQREEIQNIHLNGQKGMLPLRTELQEKKARLLSLTLGDDYDQTEANTLITEIGELHAAMLTMRTAHQRQIRSLLTEEQQVKFDTFHLNMQQRKGGMRANRPNR